MDIMMSDSSCDPYENKLGNINYLPDLLHTYAIKRATETFKYHHKHIAPCLQ
jgi:hypothetical protein